MKGPSWIRSESPNCRHHSYCKKEALGARARRAGGHGKEAKSSRVKREEIDSPDFEDRGRGYEPRRENNKASDSSEGQESACFSSLKGSTVSSDSLILVM